jgi:hypothetical protein
MAARPAIVQTATDCRRKEEEIRSALARLTVASRATLWRVFLLPLCADESERAAFAKEVVDSARSALQLPRVTPPSLVCAIVRTTPDRIWQLLKELAARNDSTVCPYTGEIVAKVLAMKETRELLTKAPPLTGNYQRIDASYRSLARTLTAGSTCSCGAMLTFKHFERELANNQLPDLETLVKNGNVSEIMQVLRSCLLEQTATAGKQEAGRQSRPREYGGNRVIQG